MSHTDLLRWNGSALEPLEYCDPSEYVLEAADSWLVEDGQTLALGLHRERFTHAIAARGFDIDPDAFWRAAIERIPNEGVWFPRVELQSRGGAGLFVLRLRSAPERSQAISLATHNGPDPRTAPLIKGPDLAAMTRLRGEAKLAGADEAVILRDGLVVEGSTTALLWWEGDVLCQPPLDAGADPQRHGEGADGHRPGARHECRGVGSDPGRPGRPRVVGTERAARHPHGHRVGGRTVARG